MADVVTPHHRVGPRKKKRNHSDSESDEGGDGGFPGGASGSDRKRSKFEHDRVDKPVDAGKRSGGTPVGMGYICGSARPSSARAGWKAWPGGIERNFFFFFFFFFGTATTRSRPNMECDDGRMGAPLVQVAGTLTAAIFNHLFTSPSPSSPAPRLRRAGSTVEEIALGDTTFVPSERIPTIVVDSFPALGRLTAMRFLEWAQRNPGGVISLPTGKTPGTIDALVGVFVGVAGCVGGG